MKTPFLSIVVVTWNNENNIEQALQSCIFEGVNDYEVIVVHNASTDDTGALVRRVADRNPELFRIIENEKNEGLGIARNIGLDAALGDFVMFLDGDDFYQPDALARVLPLLRKKKPDVLVFNHQRYWDTGGTRINANTDMLKARDVSSVEGRLEVLDNFNVAWNKVYKRAFLQKIGIRFPHRIYEDIAWHFETLVLAGRYHAIQDVLVNYRQRSGSILRSRSDAHFDIIDQYEDVFKFLSTDPEIFSTYGAAGYDHARRLMMNLLMAEERLPKASEARYLARMTDLLSRWRAAMGQRSGGVILKVADLGSPLILHAAYKASRAKKLIGKKLGRGKRLVRKFAGKVKNRFHDLFCLLPLQADKVLVEAYWGAKLDCNPLPLALALRDTGKYRVIWSLREGGDVEPDFGFQTIRKGSFRFLYHLATAKYLINNANFPTEFTKRAGSVHVQTKHGTPLKTMGLDIRPVNPREMNWSHFAERCRRWDYVISSNPYSSRVWRQGFPFQYKVLETGYPRNDLFFNATEKQVQTIREAIGIPEGKKVALYAPTFRDKGQSAIPEDEIFDPFRVAKALGPDYVLVTRGHYFTEPPGETGASVIDASAYPRSNDVALITDLLITDYSSIMFDFACLKRPIVLYPYDFDDYTASRGMYFDIRKESPGALVYNQLSLLECLASKAFASTENQAKLDRFNAEFCPWDDGHATERVIKAVFQI